jgi:hypothetical protein
MDMAYKSKKAWLVILYLQILDEYWLKWHKFKSYINIFAGD